MKDPRDGKLKLSPLRREDRPRIVGHDRSEVVTPSREVSGSVG